MGEFSSKQVALVGMAAKAVTLGTVCLLLVGFSAAQFPNLGDLFRPSPPQRRPPQQFRTQQQFRGRPSPPVRQGRVIPQQPKQLQSTCTSTCTCTCAAVQASSDL